MKIIKKKIDLNRPYPSEHACRLESPDKFDRFARKNCEQKHEGKCIDVIYGIKSGKSDIQSLRYPKGSWSADAARSHCSSRGGSFEAASGSKSISDEILFRDVIFDREQTNKEERTIPLSFSSEEPVERFFGMEILSHDPKSVRMTRANNGLALLINHDRDQQVGIVENLKIADDHKGRGMARFGKSNFAEEIFRDVMDGIRKDTSFGYRVHDMILEKEEEGMATYRVMDWEPLEISIVAVPADITVGLGREEGKEIVIENKSEIENKEEKSMEKCLKCEAILVDGKCPACAQMEKERARVADILTMGAKSGFAEKASEYAREGKSALDFAQIIIDEAKKKLDPKIEMGTDRAELAPFKEFSEYLYCVRYAPNDPRMRPLFNERAGMQSAQRAMSMGVGTAGGFAVPTQFRPELLQVGIADAMIRPKATIIPAGDPPDAAVTMPALDQGTTHGMMAGFTVGWIAEGGPKPETDTFLREITLEPHEVAGLLVVTDKLLRNWPACSSVVEMLARKAIIATEELNFISGNGVGKPLGFASTLNTAAIGVTRNGAGAIAWVDVYTMFSRLYGSRAVWLGSPTIKTQLIPMVNAASQLVWQPSAREGEPASLMGLPIYYYDRMPGLGSRGDLVLVNLEYYLIKDGSGPFFGASDQVYYTTNKTVFKIFWNVDGQPWMVEPLPLEGSPASTVSPFVILV